MVRIQYDNVAKDVEDPSHSFILTDKKGGFFFQNIHNKNFSKFCGFHVPYKLYPGWDLFKTLHAIKTTNSKPKTVFCEQNKYTVEHEDTTRVSYEFIAGALACTIDNFKGTATIEMDCRKIYDFDSHGRFYKSYKKGDFYVIEYTKRVEDSQESAVAKLSGEHPYVCYTVIAANCEITFTDQWSEQHYELEKQRDSEPKRSYTRDSAQLNIVQPTTILIASGFNLPDLSKKLKQALKPKIETQKESNTLIEDSTINEAYECALKAIDDQFVTIESSTGLYAGLPWFFQFWTRDEAISVGALITTGKLEEAKKILMRHISTISVKGRVANRFPASELHSADGLGWVCKRINDLIATSKAAISKEDQFVLRQKLIVAATALDEELGQNGVISNADLETWMDTGAPYDVRSGFRIEIQALYLAHIHLINTLSLALADNKYQKYFSYEDALKKLIKSKFFTTHLIDGRQADWSIDETIRPNIFIAYYVYPSLLSNEEWEKTFDTVINATYLNWGGFSTIDKKNPLFCQNYTGENNKSYHRGDSWFFLNAMTAIALSKVNKQKYANTINSIVTASCEEILFRGALGRHAEISDAAQLSSKGCLFQTWSSALFVELVYELYVKQQTATPKEKQKQKTFKETAAIQPQSV